MNKSKLPCLTLPLIVPYFQREITYVEEGLVIPNNTLINVGLSVREARSLTRLTTEQTVKVRANLVSTTLITYISNWFSLFSNSVTYFFNSVTLSTTSLEETCSLCGVTYTSQNNSSASPPVFTLKMVQNATKNITHRQTCL